MLSDAQRRWIQDLGRLSGSSAADTPAKPGAAAAASAREESTAPAASVRLAGSVGAQGRNAKADVLLVQGALNRRMSAGLVEDGDCGRQTIGAIVAFQKRLGLGRPDGRVDPGGPTERALNGEAFTPPAQRDGGNGSRATKPLETEDQRGGSVPEAEPDFRRLAQRIHDAAEGIGTDEEAIFAALRELGGSPANRARLGVVYREMFGEDLEAVLRDELGGGELDRADEAARSRGGPDFAALARQIHDAAAGLGTDESAIQAALAQVQGRPEHMARLREVYRSMFGESLDDVLRDELSGEDLRRAKGSLDPRREEIPSQGFEEVERVDRVERFEEGEELKGVEIEEE